MMALLQAYQTDFAKPVFQKINGAVCTLLVLSVALCFVFQFTAEQMCHTKALVVFFTNLIFWIAAGSWIARLGSLWQARRLSAAQVALVGVMVLLANQMAVRGSVDAVLSIVYGCYDLYGSWLSYLFVNNILINTACLGAFIGFGIWDADPGKQPVQRPEPEVSQLQNDVPTTDSRHFAAQISLKNGAAQIWLPVADILWIAADNNCVTFMVQGHRYVAYQSLTSVERQLDPDMFIRIHRSTLLNRHFVAKISYEPSGDGWVVLKNGERLRLSRTYKKKLQAAVRH